MEDSGRKEEGWVLMKNNSYEEMIPESLSKAWYLCSVRDTGSEDLTSAHYDYFQLLKEMNSELVNQLRSSMLTSLKNEIDETFETVVDMYKGKLIESLLEINFINSLENIESEVNGNPYKEEPDTTYLYIIEGKESRKIKIGIAKSIDSRISTLQTANPELEIINKIEFPYRSEALEAEKLFHEYFKDYRIFPKGKSTEWFKPDIKKYSIGLTKEHIPLIKEVIAKRKRKMEETVDSIHISMGDWK